MKRIGIVGLCLMAMCAISLAGSGIASAALPEWGRCVRFINQHGTPVGKYTNAACTELAEPAKTGTYEWKAAPTGVPKPEFTSHGGEAELRTTSGIATKCKTETATGLITGNKEVGEVEVLFKGCEAITFPGWKCGNALPPGYEEPPLAHNEGEILTKRLTGKLGFINKEKLEVGLVLEPAERTAHGPGVFAQFYCGPITHSESAPNNGFLTVRVGQAPTKPNPGGDTIISPITPVNQMSVANVQTYLQSEGVQVPTHLEGGKEDYLETELSDGIGEIPFGQSGQSVTTINTLNSGEELEIRASA